MARAREAVQTLLRTRTDHRPVRVELRGGTYRLDSSLEFGPEDSGTEQAPVVYTAAAGETVILSRIRYNRVHDVRRRDYGGWGIYPDQGSHDLLILNSKTNVCVFDRNLYWNTSGQPVLFGGKSFAAWQTAGQDTNSVVADPLFLDAAQGDFRLRRGSPAEQIGFEPWDLKTVGPRPVPAKSR